MKTKLRDTIHFIIFVILVIVGSVYVIEWMHPDITKTLYSDLDYIKENYVDEVLPWI